MLSHMDVEQGITRYLDAKYGTLRPATWAKHKMTLNIFGKAFASRDLDELSKKELRDWRNELVIRDKHGNVVRPLKESSKNKYMDRIKALYDFLVDEELVIRNVPAGIDRLDEPSVRRVRLPGEALGAMLGAARHPSDRAMIAVSVELLLRGGEVAELRVGDVLDGALRVLLEKAKGELAVDEMAISGELELRLHEWLGDYRRVAGILPDDAYLFPRLSVHRHGTSTVYKVHPDQKQSHPEEVVKLALAAAGYEVPVGTGGHAIRRTCARLLFDHLVRSENGDRALSHVSSLMHHSSRRTTELYLGVTGDRVMRNTLVRNSGVTPLSIAMANVAKSNRSLLSEARVYPYAARSV